MQTNINIIVVRLICIVALLLLPVTIPKAQEKTVSTAEASEKLLDAVDARDLSRVKSLLSNDWGRSLARLPVGLLAAGRAIENSYYDIAHYILAVRNQQIRDEVNKLPEATKFKTLPLKGGFISPQPKILIETRQHPPPKISPTVTKNLFKKSSVLGNSLPQISEKKLPPLLERTKDLPARSSRLNPFDPLNAPSIALPTVK